MEETVSRDEHKDLQRRVDKVEALQDEDKKLHLGLAEGQGRIEAGAGAGNTIIEAQRVA